MTTPSTSSPDLPPHRKVHVDLGPRSYDVLIGRGVMGHFSKLLQEAGVTGRTIVIADVNVPDSIWNTAFESFPFPRSDHVIKVSSGERTKSFQKGAVLASLLQNMTRWRNELAHGLIDRTRMEDVLK